MFRLFECCALSFFERFVLSFSLKIERFVSDSAEIWICGLYVNGIIARGGFELDLSWKNGKVSRLVVKSRNGGNCRLRSLNPLAGKGLRKAKGENPNKLYAIPEILQPIINKEAKLNKVELKKTYLYDLETKAGEEYIFLGK